VTRDGLVDRLVQWWEAVRERCAPLTTLVSTGENGPENQSRRTQWMQRRVAFVQQYRVTIRLAYSPPSHSTSNPIERCWGILEHHGHGTVLDAIDTVLPCARTMTWHGTHPIVPLVTPTYQTGVTWTKDAMETVEAQLKRLPNLGTWFVDIVSSPPAIRDTSLFLSPLALGCWEQGCCLAWLREQRARRFRMNAKRLLILTAWLVGWGLIVGLWPVTGQQAPPTENKGVKIDTLVTIDLGPEIDGMQGRQLRLRLVTVEPGGVIALHSHKDRPAVSRVLQGTLTEHREGGVTKEHAEGESGASGKDTTHWEENRGTKPVVIIASDIFKQ